MNFFGTIESNAFLIVGKLPAICNTVPALANWKIDFTQT